MTSANKNNIYISKRDGQGQIICSGVDYHFDAFGV